MKKIIGFVVALSLALTMGACQQEEVTRENYNVNLYFANKEYIVSGSEDLEKLQSEERSIELGESSLGERLIEELEKGPESDELETAINENMDVQAIVIADGLAQIDFSQEGLNGSSMEEFFVMNQIILTFLDLEEVEGVQFLVEGQPAESLMGHYDASGIFEEALD